jgi:hypothetical protein
VGCNRLRDLGTAEVAVLNPYGYIAISLALLALICWAIYRMDRAKNKAALDTARAENREARRIEAGRKLFERAARNRED